MVRKVALFVLACLLLLPTLAQSPKLVPKPYRPNVNTWLVCHGDSITMGVTLSSPSTQAYCARVASAAVAADPSKVFGDLNYGINGQGLNYVYPFFPSNTFGTLTADAVTRVDPVLSQQGTKWLVIFAGTNDIFLNNTSGANTWTLLQTYLNARTSAGWPANHICVVTMLPRQGSQESNRTAYNNAIRSNQAGMGYLIADAGADPTIGCAGCDSNATYYSDTIHPTAAGQQIIANLIGAQIFP